jgi:hypothetical protein
VRLDYADQFSNETASDILFKPTSFSIHSCLLAIPPTLPVDACLPVGALSKLSGPDTERQAEGLTNRTHFHKLIDRNKWRTSRRHYGDREVFGDDEKLGKEEEREGGGTGETSGVLRAVP